LRAPLRPYVFRAFSDLEPASAWLKPALARELLTAAETTRLA
jgi:hypothetical protein